MPSTLFGLLALASSAFALPSKRSSGNTVSFDVVKASYAATPQTVNAQFTPANSIYLIDVTLGSPAQRIYAYLDTGSSNLVVFPKSQQNTACPFTDQDICNSLTYESGNSNTYVQGASFSVSYSGGSKGQGYVGTDTLNFEGQTLAAFEFVDLTISNTLPEAIFGTGYASNEGSNVAPYPNLPQRLVTAGAINAPVFSLWLNSLRSSSPGSALYGGIDTQKYCGNLVSLPVVKENNNYVELAVSLSSVTAGTPGGNQATIPLAGSSISALLDSGTNSIVLATAAYNALYNQYNAQPAQTANGFPQVDCDLGTSSQAVSFTFGNGAVTIPVPLSQLVSPGPSGSKCNLYLTQLNAGNTVGAILGSPFLASAYSVFDLGNNNIYLAPAIFDPASSNVLVVSAGPNGVPSSAGPACAATTSTTTSTSTTTTSTISTSTMSTTSTTSTSASTTTSTMSTTGSTSTSSSSTSSSTTTSGTGSISPILVSTTSSTGTSTSTSSTSSTSSSSVWSNGWASWQSSSSSISNNWGTWQSSKPSASNNWGTWQSSVSSVSNHGWPAAVTAPADVSAVWTAWNGYPVPSGMSYSTVTTTIYVCPDFAQGCASKTASVSKVVIPYTTSTVYTTKPVTVTAACPTTTVCGGAYYTTTWTTVSLTTTVCPYNSPPPANTGSSVWSGWNSGAGKTPDATSVGTWSAWSSGAGKTPDATSVSMPAQSSAAWSGWGNGASPSGLVQTYTGAAASSFSVGHVASIMAALVAPAALMLVL